MDLDQGAYMKANMASMMFGLPMLRWSNICQAHYPDLGRRGRGAQHFLDRGAELYSALGIALMTIGQLLVGLERVNALAVSLVLCALAIIGSSIVVAPCWGLTGIAFCMAVEDGDVLADPDSGNCGASSARRTPGP